MYKRGVFSDLEAFPEGLESGQFKDRMIAYIRELLDAGHPVQVAYGKHEDNFIPLGLIVTFVDDMHATPMFYWLPEATLRNRLELTGRALVALKAENLVLINTQEVAFFQHFAKYGILRRVGTIREWEPGVDTVMFQSVRK